MLPKRRFWKEEQKMTSRVSTNFSMVRSPNRVLTPLKSAQYSEQKLRDFRTPYLKKRLSIREYSNLGHSIRRIENDLKKLY